MVGSNLPDDVSPGDIDDHFGEPETKIIVGSVTLPIEVETQFFDSDSEMKSELRKQAKRQYDVDQILHAEIGEVI